MADQPRDHLHPKDLDGAMKAAFGGPRRESVLHSLGLQSRVLLHDIPGAETPIVRPTPAAQDDTHYEIVGEIATGGVGVVFKGLDRDLGREVALKVLRTEHAANPQAVARFVEEAQIGGQLQHPGIVPVYGLGLQDDGRPYFTMKLIRGRTLAAVLKEEPRDERRMLQIFEQICQTMAYAHSRGVIHRDLKPSNVMIGSFGEVHVVDWGFGKVLGREELIEEDRTIVATVRSSGEGSESMSGSIMGTPAYMPPEQALGYVDELNERADVFALGAILCEILTGDPPYTGRRQDLLVKAAQARTDDALARLDDSGADSALVTLAKHCLGALPEDRPDHAGILAGTIQAYFAAAEERTRAAEVEAVAERARLAHGRAEAEAARRAKRVTRWAAASIVLAVAVGATLWWRHEVDVRERADAARPEFERALESSAGHATRAEWGPALADAREALALARANGLDDRRAREAVERAATAKSDEEARARLVRTLDAIRLRGAGDYGSTLAFLPDVPRPFDTPALRQRIGAALDHWASLEPARRDALLAHARHVDPHPQRDRIRTGAVPDIATLDARSLDAAGLLGGDVSLLERARRRHPGDLWLNLQLGRALRAVNPQRARYYLQAAHALREAAGP